MLDDLKKLAASSELFSLERIISMRLFTLAYLLGLATIVILAMNHLFFSFSFGFGNGLWGLLEIAVIAPLALLGLRIACEAAILFFKNNHQTIELVNQQQRLTDMPDLIVDVGEAIDDLANQVTAAPTNPTQKKPAAKPVTTTKTANNERKTPRTRKAVRDSAKRKPASPGKP
ncbi:hypothetical protein MNBD_ALPHA12-1087 [hydrothermal vent metagenome]|uniref:DUF4282 domain-containing protein n=1 Tax=hydrothermal vent metagenome TaxID=652676 RepID=A0A3B0T793_9ZZZZ